MVELIPGTEWDGKSLKFSDLLHFSLFSFTYKTLIV